MERAGGAKLSGDLGQVWVMGAYHGLLDFPLAVLQLTNDLLTAQTQVHRAARLS